MAAKEAILVLNVALSLVSFIANSPSAANHTDACNRSQPIFAKQHPNDYVFQTDENGNPQTLILPCRIVNPSPTVSYTWFRGDQELPGSMVNGEGSLIVPNITEGEYASRKGVDYYCIACDNIGFYVAVRSRTITVYYAYFDGFERMVGPGGNTMEVPIPVALNSEVALECGILSINPPPQIKWYNDLGPIQEDLPGNVVRFLDEGRYLYLSRLQPAHLQRQYYCAVTNVNLSQEVAAPNRYVLTDNITQGVLTDYKQIGNLRAFVGNSSIEFAFVGGVFGDVVNQTINTLRVNGREVAMLGSIGIIDTTALSMPGMLYLEASINYNGGLTAVRSGTMSVFQIPRITNRIQDERNLFAGKGILTYTCQYEGFPLPNISFYFNGAPISLGSGVTISDNTLIIPSPQVFQSGVYQCIISNEVGDDQLAWLLEIREPIIPQMQRNNFAELNVFDDRDLGALVVMNNGSTVSISVDILADPCPTILWSFNGTALTPNDSNISYNNPCIKGSSTSLNIWTYTLNVVLTSDTSGHYSANFTNVAGTTFLPRTYFTIPGPVSITGLSLNETCLKEGSSISIRCNIRGFPRPTIEFHKNGDEINPEVGMFSNIILEFYDQIAIKNATMKDEGLYSCIALTTMGTLDQATQMFEFCTVPIFTGIDITPTPSVGEPFFIECAAEGIPTPNTAWVKDGVPLEERKDGHNLRIVAIPARKSSRLEVSNANIDFNGEYQCIVSNIAGSVRHSFTIELTHAPAPLGLIVGISVGGTLFITVALCIIIVLVCVMCRICVHDKSNMIKPQSANTYSANVAYLERLRVCYISSDNELVIDPLYDTIPYSDPSEVRTKGGLAHEMERIHKRAHIYDKIIYEDAQQPSCSDTSAVRNVMKNVSKDESQELENNNKYNSKCSHDENDGKKKQKGQKIDKQEPNSNSESVKGTNPKHSYSDYGSELRGITKETIEAGTPSEKGHHDDNGPPHDQVYASISAEVKAKKRIKMLKKQQKYQVEEKEQQREDQKESSSQRKMEEIMESGKLKKEANEKMEAKMECDIAEKGQADKSKEESCQCQNAGGDES